MQDTKERIRKVKLLARKMQYKRENRLIRALTGLCLILSLSLVGAVGLMTGAGGATVSGLYGTILLYEDAGGYVLVGLIAFALAVVITTLCLRYRENIKRVAINKDEVKE